MRARSILTLGNFFSSAHFFLIVYIVAPYLATVMPASSSGLVVSLGAIITLSCFPFMPLMVSRYSAQRLAIYLAGLECLVLLALAAYPSPVLAVLLVACALSISPLLAYQLDLLLEASVDSEGDTGKVRTIFLTGANIALVCSPLLLGYLLDDSNHYTLVFFWAALSLVPFMLLMLARRFPQVSPPKTHRLLDAYVCIAADHDLRAVALANAVLQFFFHLAPIYIPLYLHNVIGIPWVHLGTAFAISLIPFVLLEYPAGWVADRKLGDRFFLALGFVIMGLSFAALGSIQLDTSLFVIVFLLILTRVGAALVEAMVESHFFRRVSADDTNTVSVFRMMRPAGALIAPIVGTLLLSLLGFGGLFVIGGFIILGLGFFAATSISSGVNR